MLFFLYFECAGKREEWLLGPVFGLKTMYDILLFESDLGTLDTSNLGLNFFLFCCTTKPSNVTSQTQNFRYSTKLYGVVEKMPLVG